MLKNVISPAFHPIEPLRGESVAPAQKLPAAPAAGSYILALFIAFQISYIMKRAIFLIGQPSQMVYYAMIGLPIPFLIAALTFTRAAQDGKTRITSLSLWFLIMLGSLWTLISGTGAETLGTIFLIGAPMCGYFLGMTLKGRLSRTLVIAYLAAILISVTYATVQFFVGMTPLDRAWAVGSASYSMQGTKALVGTIGDQLRPFSYFPDTMTWSTFIVAAGVIIWIGRMQRLIRQSTFAVGMAFCVAGLFVALSRSPWLIVAVTMTCYILLRIKLFRSAAVLFAAAAATFFIATSGSQFALDNLYVSYNRFSDPLENRFVEIGTLHDRAISYDLLAKAYARYPFIGAGLARRCVGARLSMRSNGSLRTAWWSTGSYIGA